MLTRLRQDGLGLEGEIALLILQIEERRSGCDTVFHRYGNGVSGCRYYFAQMTRFDAQHVGTGTYDPAFVMEAQTQIRLGGLAVEHVLRRLSVRTGRGILHLPETCSGQGEPLTQTCVHTHLRATVERTEGCTAVERDHVTEIRCHRVPGLTNRQVHARKILIVHAQAVPTETHVRLTETELRRTGDSVRAVTHFADTRKKVRFDLTAELGITPFVSDDIESHTGRQTQETEGTYIIEVLAQRRIGRLVPVFVLGHVEIQVTRSGNTFPAVVGEVVTDKPIGFKMLFEVRLGCLFLGYLHAVLRRNRQQEQRAKSQNDKL